MTRITRIPLLVLTLVLTLVLISFCAFAQEPTDTIRQRVLVETNRGKFTLELYNETPIHRDNFIGLVKSRSYEGTLFHRVISQFMVQGGNMQSKNAGPDADLSQDTISKRIPAEILYPQFFHRKGSLCAAHEGDESNPERASSSTQFYIVTGSYFSEIDLKRFELLKKISFSPEMREAYKLEGGTPHLDGAYTVFGRVIDGMDVIEKIERTNTDNRNRPSKDIIIKTMQLIPAP